MNWGERRKLFNSMVESFGMDPLVPETWYRISRDLVASHWVPLCLFVSLFLVAPVYTYCNNFKGIRSVLACYKGNLGRAVSHLFPV
jgi:hypothetical protein